MVDWPQTRKYLPRKGVGLMFGDKQNYVGQFYQWAGHRLLGGELSLNENGDICLWKEHRSIEVKSSGYLSSYGFRCHREQIEEYERMSCFPFEGVWYVFFSYRNRSLVGEDGKRHTEFAKHTTPLEVNQYLANTTLWCTIVDLSIISRWNVVKPVSTKSVVGHLGRETVNIKCWEVARLTNGGFKYTLEGLGLDSADFGILTGKVAMVVEPDLLAKYHMKFQLNVVLPREELRVAKRLFWRRKFRLKEVKDMIPVGFC